MPKAPALAILMAGAAACRAAPADHATYLAEFQAAEQAHRPFQPITSFDPATSLEEAYVIQHELVDHRLAGGDRTAGYRGGLMSDASLRQRAVTEPLVGVQFRSGLRHSPATISLAAYRHAAIEVKIGFVFGRDLASGSSSLDQIRKAVKAVVAVIDVPDIGYADPLHYSAVDMVASDISSALYVEGDHTRRCFKLDAETMTLTRDGQVVTQGRSQDSLGDVWQSLKTVVNLAQQHGYRIHRGQIVLTGKLGGKVDVAAGHYVATLPCLGPVSVQLTG